MKFEIGAMSVGDILDRGLKLLFSNLVAFYVINLIVLAPNIALQMFLPDILAQSQGDLFAGAIVGLLGLVLAIIILAPIGSAAILYIISRDFVGQQTTIGDAFKFALGKLPSLLWTSILMGLMVMFGLILCIVPGIIFSVWYVFFAQVVVVEGISGISALSRSKALTEGYRWRVFGLLVLFAAMGMILGIIAGLIEVVYPSRELIPNLDQAVKNVPPNPFAPQGTFKKIYPNIYINTMVTQLVNILVQTFSAVCITLLYFDLRIRKEGFDLELAAKQQPVPTQAIP